MFAESTMSSSSLPSIWTTLNSWLTPTVLFLLLNLMIVTIAFISFTSNNKPTTHTSHDHQPLQQLARSPSFVLQGLKSINFYSSHDTPPPTTSNLEFQQDSPGIELDPVRLRLNSIQTRLQQAPDQDRETATTGLVSETHQDNKFGQSNNLDVRTTQLETVQSNLNNVRTTTNNFGFETLQDDTFNQPNFTTLPKSRKTIRTQSDTVQTRLSSLRKSEAYNQTPQPPLSKSPSLLQRFKSINLHNYLSPDSITNQSPNLYTPEPEKTQFHEEFEETLDEVYSRVRNVSEFNERETRTKLQKKMSKSMSSKTGFVHSKEEEIVESRRPATVRGKSSESKWITEMDDAEVDAKADDFINRFRQQLKLQRIDSIIRGIRR